MSRLTLALCLIFAALSASLQLPACCTAASRLPASRVAGVAHTAVCMCDAPAEEAAAPVEAAAEPAAEETAPVDAAPEPAVAVAAPVEAAPEPVIVGCYWTALTLAPMA